jgi:hypothetical protein
MITREFRNWPSAMGMLLHLRNMPNIVNVTLDHRLFETRMYSGRK